MLRELPVAFFIPSKYTEYWKFDNINGRWLLDEIKPVYELEEII